jgi:hypothetical protein
MYLSPNNFSKGDGTKRFSIGGVSYDTPYVRYSYETNKKLYDVEIRNSDKVKTYRVNCGFETEPTNIHKAIEKHFNI